MIQLEYSIQLLLTRHQRWPTISFWFHYNSRGNLYLPFHFIFIAFYAIFFIPFQIVLIHMAKMLGALGLAGSLKGLVFVNTVYGIGFTTLFFRNYYAAFPAELVRSARMDGAGFYSLFGF